MPPSVLMGRVVRPGDPQWTQGDTDMAVALMELEAGTCTGCGLPREQTLAHEGDGFRFTAQPVRCRGCEAMDRESRRHADMPRWDSAGIRWSVRRDVANG